MEPQLVLGIVAAVLGVWLAMLAMFWVLRPKSLAVRELLGLVPDVVRLLRSVITDSTAPLDVRLILVGLLAWILSPVDLIPEFIPVLGPLDDIVVAVVALRYVRRRLGVANLSRRWSGSAEGFDVLIRVMGTD